MKHTVATWLTLGAVSSTRLSVTHVPFVLSDFFKATSRQVAVRFKLRELQAQLRNASSHALQACSASAVFFLAKADHKAGSRCVFASKVSRGGCAGLHGSFASEGPPELAARLGGVHRGGRRLTCVIKGTTTLPRDSCLCCLCCRSAAAQRGAKCATLWKGIGC